MSRPDQRAFADASHFLHLPVAFASDQQFKPKLNLCVSVLSRSAIVEIRIHPRNALACLRPLHDHAAIVLRKGKHDRQNQVACQGVLHQAHVEDVHLHAALKQATDSLNTVNGCSGEPVQLRDHKRVRCFQLVKERLERRTFHRLACEGFLNNLLTSI